MSRKSRRRTTGPKYRDIKTFSDLTDWLNRGVARGAKDRLYKRKRKKQAHIGGGMNLGRASRQLRRMGR